MSVELKGGCGGVGGVPVEEQGRRRGAGGAPVEEGGGRPTTAPAKAH